MFVTTEYQNIEISSIHIKHRVLTIVLPMYYKCNTSPRDKKKVCKTIVRQFFFPPRKNVVFLYTLKKKIKNHYLSGFLTKVKMRRIPPTIKQNIAKILTNHRSDSMV